MPAPKLGMLCLKLMSLPPDIDFPSLMPHGARAILARADGTCESLSLAAAASLLEEETLLICHRLLTGKRLGVPLAARAEHLLDVMELLAFIRPATPCAPNGAGLAAALGRTPPKTPQAGAQFLRESVGLLLGEISAPDFPARALLARRAQSMAEQGWNWGAAVAKAAGIETAIDAPLTAGADSYDLLEVWREAGTGARETPVPLQKQQVEAALESLLAARSLVPRAEQKTYALGAARAFGLEEKEGEIMLVQAGTGTGKTLAYAVPSLLAARREGAAVWIATYTRNLQTQLAEELALTPETIAAPTPPRPGQKTHPPAALKPVIRKGRENYLCLLNFASIAQAPRHQGEALLAGFIARWIPKTSHGDLRSGDFPSWLPGLLGGDIGAFTDRRGECIHAACPHYRRCFIEKARSQSNGARLVITNHALVLSHVGQRWAKGDRGDSDKSHATTPYYVFDEAHRLFDSADMAFSRALTGFAMAELSNWLFGASGASSASLRGLARRLVGLLDDKGEAWLAEMLAAASFLPRAGWLGRLKKPTLDKKSNGAGEFFLHALHDFILKQSSQRDGFYDASTRYENLPPPLAKASQQLAQALDVFLAAGRKLIQALAETGEEADDASLAARKDSAARMLAEKLHAAKEWHAMLTQKPDDEEKTDEPEQIIIARLARRQGKLTNVGLHLHFLDPTELFAKLVLAPAPGALLTSATLQEPDAQAHDNWQSAEWRTGGHHLTPPPGRLTIGSPFDYQTASLVLAVHDVPLEDEKARHEALCQFFLAAQGGGLGLFTSIRRLQKAAAALAEPMAREGLLLLSQHLDPLSPADLVSLFRAEAAACLLGTDALRDGIDVPGEGLKLVVFDRLPFPRPDALHVARRQHFGQAAYDAMITRLRLHQAFGRLIRREKDYGLFVLLDRRFSSRFAASFPVGTPIERVGLEQALEKAHAFFARHRN